MPRAGKDPNVGMGRMYGPPSLVPIACIFVHIMAAAACKGSFRPRLSAQVLGSPSTSHGRTFCASALLKNRPKLLLSLSLSNSLPSLALHLPALSVNDITVCYTSFCHVLLITLPFACMQVCMHARMHERMHALEMEIYIHVHIQKHTCVYI